MATQGRLAGKRALITGAGVGLGAQIARRFRQEGAEVLINDLRLETAERVAKELGGTAYAADVSDSAAVREMFERIGREFDRLDILVNNAGIAFDGDPITAGMEKILQARIPGAKNVAHVTIQGGGHFLQETNGEEVARKMVTFLQAHPRGA